MATAIKKSERKPKVSLAEIAKTLGKKRNVSIIGEGVTKANGFWKLKLQIGKDKMLELKKRYGHVLLEDGSKEFGSIDEVKEFVQAM